MSEGRSTKKDPPARESVIVPLVLTVATMAALVVAWLVDGEHDGSSRGSLPWILLGMGIASIAIALFDRQQQVGPGTGLRTQALVMVVGPTGARIVYALIGGGFLGGAIRLFFS